MYKSCQQLQEEKRREEAAAAEEKEGMIRTKEKSLKQSAVKSSVFYQRVHCKYAKQLHQRTQLGDSRSQRFLGIFEKRRRFIKGSKADYKSLTI